MCADSGAFHILLIRLPLLSGDGMSVLAGTFHPSGEYPLSASDDGTIRVWELVTAQCIKTVHMGSTSHVFGPG